MDFSWKVHNDQCGSDHFPVFIKAKKSVPTERPQRWKLAKADWYEYEKIILIK
jgi:hypothetical protein